MEVFKEHIKIIKKLDYNFNKPEFFISNFDRPKRKEILITIDDGFKSFYNNAWPFLRDNEIPFILFISTEPVGKKGYMSWDEIKEIERSKFTIIGHHSHTHEYLIDMDNSEFIKDIEIANKIFENELGYIPQIFSYPFGEYSKFMKDYISENFKVAFGQHSGIIDINKDKFELPRFPINEKYGDLKRFKSLINYKPLEYKNLKPEEKKLNENNNPPKVTVEFFQEQKNINNINCYSNEGGTWKKTDLKFQNQVLIMGFKEKFVPRRGRVNCSLNDNGQWRWFGTQFTVKKN
jgi:peptidoglycan/xylan/chitin deacetylase (PgdA/CDA1 family)